MDGDGLMLVVRPSGKKSWLLRYQMNGIRRDMGLGSYPEIGLREARQRTTDARRMIEAGADPIAARQAAHKAARPIPTFGEIAALVVADAQAKTANEKVKYQWQRHLGRSYSGPLLDRPVHEITTLEIASVLRPIWRAKPEVARKTYPAIRRVFDRARVILRDEHGVTMNRNPQSEAISRHSASRRRDSSAEAVIRPSRMTSCRSSSRNFGAETSSRPRRSNFSS